MNLIHFPQYTNFDPLVILNQFFFKIRGLRPFIDNYDFNIKLFAN